jgi:hypothetical protein
MWQCRVGETYPVREQFPCHRDPLSPRTGGNLFVASDLPPQEKQPSEMPALPGTSDHIWRRSWSHVTLHLKWPRVIAPP